MDYFSIFDISAAGMSVQKARVDTVALNIANSETTRTSSGGAYKPMQVVVGEAIGSEFDKVIAETSNNFYRGSYISEVVAVSNPTKMVYKPDHKHADANGMVEYPNINPAFEMVNLLEATRSYEANVKALNGSISLAQSALEIGR